MSSCPSCSHPLEKDVKFCPECGVKIAAAPADSMLGRTLHGKYRLERELGRGSMGTVYVAEHVGLRKKVALKVLHKDLQLGEEALQRFQREGIAAGRFSHRNAISIFDFDRDDDLTYLAMELVDGQSLKQLVAGRGKLPVDEAAEILRQVLAALAAAHAQGIVHRDLKPENIMVHEDAEAGISVKVLDFGLSKLADNRLELSLHTQPGRVLGTPLYMAPEQWDGADVDARADLYAAGLILYEMITGEQPFRADSTSASLVKKATGEVPSLRQSQPGLRAAGGIDRFLATALAKEPADRFPTAEAMAAALSEALAGGRVRAPKSERRQPAPRTRRTRPAPARPAWLLPAGAGVVAGLAALVWWLAAGGSNSAAAAPAATELVSARPRASLSADEVRYVEALQEARDHLRRRDPRLAIGVLDDALRLPAADAEAFVLRGDAYRMHHELAKAAMDYREAIAARSDYAEAHAGLGWVSLEEGRVEDAEACFGRARALVADRADTLAGLGAVRARQARPKEAAELLDQAEKLAPRSAFVRDQVGRARLLAGDLDGATEAFLQATRNDSRYWPALAGLGEAFERRGRVPDAIEQYDAVLRIEPDAPGVRQRLGALLVASGRNDEAAAQLTTALRQQPEHPELLVLLGLAEQGRNASGQAIAALEAARTAGSKDARARCVLGTLLVQAERWADAATAFREAIGLDDELALAHQDLGLVLIQQGQYADAAPPLQRALELDPEAAFAHFALGVLHKDYLGDRAAAARHLGRYRELGGTDARVPDWLRELEK